MACVEDFYVTLLSNAQVDGEFKNNRPNNFTNRLPYKIDLEGSWEVGVTQIQFDNYLKFRTPKFELVVWVFEEGSDMSEPAEEGYEASDLETRLLNINTSGFNYDKMKHRFITIREGVWSSDEEFGKHVAYVINKHFKETVVYMHSAATANKFCIVNEKKKLEIGFSSVDDELFEILGVRKRHESERLSNGVLLYGFADTRTNKREERLPTTQNIFMYSNIVDKQIVGGRKVKLLKYIPVKTGHRKWQTNFFDMPTYTKVSESSLTDINVFLRDDQGKPVEFIDTRSHVSMQLHFRKRRRDFPFPWL